MVNADTFVGMSKSAGQNKAEALNLVFRLVSVNGETFLGLPEDTRDDRVCVEVNATKITKAIIQ